MPTPIDIDAAVLQRFTKRDMLAALLEAKRQSDHRNYERKSEIMRKLLTSPNRDEFVVDSEDKDIVGLTHSPLKFKIHLLRKQIPDYDKMPRAMKKSAYVTDQYWDVAATVDEMIDTHGDIVLSLKEAAEHLPLLKEKLANIYYNLDTDRISIHGGNIHPLLGQAWAAGLDKEATISEEEYPEGFFDEPWTLIKSACLPFTKNAVAPPPKPGPPVSRAPGLKAVTDLWGLTDGPVNKWYGGARPLSSMLVGSLAGAGLGYLGGAFAEKTTGGFEKGRLRRLLAVLGAAGGATPGLVWGGMNAANHGMKGWVSDSDGKVAMASVRQLLPEFAKEALFMQETVGNSGAGLSNPFMREPIRVDDFNNVVWSTNDPFSPFNVRASASGLVEAASSMRGNSPLVSPLDIAKTAIGMGSGYMAGSLVGKTLGALAGLKPEHQKTLQQAGTWAGMLKTIMPLAFGGSSNSF